jgi:hypothetical protein
MRNAAKHIEGESFVCQQALLKVFMPILQKAIAGARAMFKGAPKTDVTKLALKYMQAERQIGEELLPALKMCDMPPLLRAQALAVLEQAAARVALSSQN